MRWLLFISSLLLVLATAEVVAPRRAAETPANEEKASPAPDAKQSSKAQRSPAEMRKLSDAFFKQCLNDWDAGTHMSKQQWQRTCRRLADNRVKFMVEEMGK